MPPSCSQEDGMALRGSWDSQAPCCMCSHLFYCEPVCTRTLCFSKAFLCCPPMTTPLIFVKFHQTTLPASWEICMQVKKQQLELDMEQQTGSKSGKECIKAVYCHPAYLTSMQSTSWEMLGWRKHKMESRLPGEISITSDTQMTPSLWQKAKN